MELPAALRSAIDDLLEGSSIAELKDAATKLSRRYRAEIRDGKWHMSDDLAVRGYLATRMPATYAAVAVSLAAGAEALPEFHPQTLLDIGSGPGTALWAARDCWQTIQSATMIEGSAMARKIGAELARHLPAVTQDWITLDITEEAGNLNTADLVTMAYVLDELDPSRIAPIVTRLWSLTTEMMVIIEPGTPAGWQRILAVRKQLIEAGAYIAAPCPHLQPCPIEAPDWCHFSRKVSRSRLHRLSKGAEVPWEDEKFAYVAATRSRPSPIAARVLSPPRAGSGQVRLKLCEADGSVSDRLITKRNGETFRTARRAAWGDAL